MLSVWDRRSEFQIIESVQFYFNKIDTIKMPDYLPDKVRTWTGEFVRGRVYVYGCMCVTYMSAGVWVHVYRVWLFIYFVFV